MGSAALKARSSSSQGSVLRRYGLAHYGKSLLWQSGELLFTFFLIQTCGLSLTQAALVLVAAMVLNAVIDVALGQYLSRRSLSLRGAARLQLAGASVATMAFAAVGATAMLDEGWRLPAAAIGLLILRGSYPFLDLPQNTMLALLTVSERERSGLAALRVGLSGAAAITSASAFIAVFRGEAVSVQAHGFMVVSALFAITAWTGALVLWHILERSDHSRITQPADAAVPISFVRMASFLGHRRLIFAAIFGSSLAWSSFVRLQPYAATYAIEGISTGYAFVVGIAFFSALSQLVWLRLAKRRSVEDALLIAAMTLAVGSLSLGFAVNMSLWTVLVAVLLYGTGSGGVTTSIWALAARYARDRGDGGYATFGLLTGCSKLGIAAGTLAGITMIGALGLNGDAVTLTSFYWPTLIPASVGVLIANAATYLESRRLREAAAQDTSST